jgi:hypothetical protein
VLGDAPALISFGNSNLTATGTSPLFMVRSSLTPGNPSTANLGGPLLSAAGSSFNLTGSSYVLVAENGRITGSGATPLIQSDNSQFTTSSNFLSVTDVSTVNPGTPGPATVNLAGPFIADTGSTFNMGGRFSFVGGASSVTTGQFAGLSGTTVNTGNDFAQITETGSKMTLSGPMLSANGGSLNIGTNPSAGGDVLDVNSGGQLVVNSNEPVIAFNGGSIAVGTADATTNNTPNRVARLQGDTVNGISPVTGLGTFQPVIGNGSSPAPFAGATHPIGTLIQATGGAAIQVNAGAGDTVGGGVGPGNAIQVDRALFEAALPMIKLIGTGTTNTTTASSLTTANGTMDIFQSKVVSNGSVIALDNGLISVNNGPLITLRNGSTMDVTGDLLTLTNHSQINVVNGPLIRVTGNSGNGSSPSVSTLNVSGALVNFGGTGGNTIVVNNDIAPNGTVSGIPVSGNNFSIGPNPIKNSGLGSIIVNGATVGSASSFTGSLIQTQNGGRVNILAP